MSSSIYNVNFQETGSIEEQRQKLNERQRKQMQHER
jgi:hypothetical protein